MDSQTNIPKRKRVNTIKDELIIAGAANDDDTIIVDDSRYGLPSITEDDPDDSDVDQPDDKPIEKSTLFWDIQLIISLGEDDKIRLGKPSAEHQLKSRLPLLCQLFNYYLSNKYIN
jgi:hypothetical protein